MKQCIKCGEWVRDDDICQGMCVDCFDYNDVTKDEDNKEESLDDQQTEEETSFPILDGSLRRGRVENSLNRKERRLAEKNAKNKKKRSVKYNGVLFK